MASHQRLFLALFHVIGAFAAIPPREIVWSTTSYGPDGPWQAVSLHLGTPPQPIDLYPGGFWMSNVLDTVICTSPIQTSFCYSRDAGLYNISASQTNDIRPEPGPKISQALLYPSQGNCIPQFGTFQYMFDRLTISDASQNPSTVAIESLDMLVFDEAYSFLPDGSPYPIQVGNLALGAPDFNQTWLNSLGGNAPHINGTFLPSYLFAKGYAESNSWGLHYGSASLGIPGSLYIGGYDRSRVLGPITVGTVGSFLAIDLLDIGIGVAEGHSPFNFSSKSGLLGQGNSSITGSLKVNVDATSPYLYLPKSTCDAIAENLPVTFQPKYGLYFWDTSSPRYTQIVSSPSFLSLAFRLNSSITQNVTINIPFALLNLTLTPPLVTTPTQYFPCNPLSHPPPAADSIYALGKAFLQAAFIGVNWGPTGNDNWFLAQAPGPKTPTAPIPMSIGQTDRYILSSTTPWYDTWKGVLTPLTQDVQPGGSTSTSAGTTAPASPNSSTSPPASPSSISVSTIAGIAIGAAILVIAAITTLFFVVTRRRAKHSESKAQAPSASVIETATSHPMPNLEDWKRRAGFPPREMNAMMDPAELAEGTGRGGGGLGGRVRGRDDNSRGEMRYELSG